MDAPTLEALQDEENDLPIGNMHFTWKPPQPVEAKGGYHQPPPEDWASAPSYAVGNSLDGDPSQQSRAGSSLGPITGLNRRFFTERPLPAAPGTSPSQQHLSTSGTPPLLEGNQRSATDDDGLDQFDGPNPRETVVALGALFSQLTYLDLGHWFLHGPVLARMGKSMSCLQVWHCNLVLEWSLHPFFISYLPPSMLRPLTLTLLDLFAVPFRGGIPAHPVVLPQRDAPEGAQRARPEGLPGGHGGRGGAALL